MFDKAEGTNVFKVFEKYYSFHSYSGLAIARKEGVKYFKEYWNLLNSLELHINFIAKIYYFLLLFLGEKKSDVILGRIKYFVKRKL